MRYCMNQVLLDEFTHRVKHSVVGGWIPEESGWLPKKEQKELYGEVLVHCVGLRYASLLSWDILSDNTQIPSLDMMTALYIVNALRVPGCRQSLLCWDISHFKYALLALLHMDAPTLAEATKLIEKHLPYEEE